MHKYLVEFKAEKKRFYVDSQSVDVAKQWADKQLEYWKVPAPETGKEKSRYTITQVVEKPVEPVVKPETQTQPEPKKRNPRRRRDTKN